MNVMEFDFKGSGIRTLRFDGEPWFVANDVANALGYSNCRDAVRKHCRRVEGVAICDAMGREQLTNVICESDVYRLIFRSKLPAAELFEEWVVGEVLPEIRRSGGYIHASHEMSDDDILARAVVLAQAKIRDREERLLIAERERDEAIAEKSRINGRQMATALGKVGGLTRSIRIVRDCNDDMVYDVSLTVDSCVRRVMGSVRDDAVGVGIPSEHVYRYGWKVFRIEAGIDRVRPRSGDGSLIFRILLSMKANARIVVRNLAVDWDRRKCQKGFRKSLLSSLSEVYENSRR